MENKQDETPQFAVTREEHDQKVKKEKKRSSLSSILIVLFLFIAMGGVYLYFYLKVHG